MEIKNIPLQKIYNGTDRTTFLFMENEKDDLLAILVFKNELVNEFGENSIDNANNNNLIKSLEVKTMYVTKGNEGEGIIDFLLWKVISIASIKKANSIILTVGEHVSSKNFFEKRGFEQVGEIFGKYIADKNECYLKYSMTKYTLIIDVFSIKNINDLSSEELFNILFCTRKNDLREQEKMNSLAKGHLLMFYSKEKKDEKIINGFLANVTKKAIQVVFDPSSKTRREYEPLMFIPFSYKTDIEKQVLKCVNNREECIDEKFSFFELQVMRISKIPENIIF